MDFGFKRIKAQILIGLILILRSSSGGASFENPLALSLKEGGSAEDVGSFIVGGIQAKKNEFPFQACLRYRGRHRCGGSIYNSRYIITAAHCVDGEDFDMDELRIIAGEHDLNVIEDTEQSRRVVRILIHPGYFEETRDDVAILELDSPLELNKVVQSIKIAEPGMVPTGNSIVSGWGRTSSQGYAPSILRKVTVPIITDAECRKYYEKIYDSEICAFFKEGGKDACQGDSGGPLIQGPPSDPILIGVVSWGIGCAWPGYPGVYAEVSYSYDWIINNTI